MDISVESASSRLGRTSEPTRISPVVLCGIVGIAEATITFVVGLLLYYVYLRADAAATSIPSSDRRTPRRGTGRRTGCCE